MNDYADTGFLCSLYAPDAHSARAIAAMKKQSAPLAFTSHLRCPPSQALHGSGLESEHLVRAITFRKFLVLPHPIIGFCAGNMNGMAARERKERKIREL